MRNVPSKAAGSSPASIGCPVPVPSAATTDLLNSWAAGDRDSADRLLRRMYPSLYRLASKQLARWSSDLSLDPSDVVQELYLKMARQEGLVWENREQFFALAARLVRRLLVDEVRLRRRHKRGGGGQRVELEETTRVVDGPAPDLLALDQALDRLAAICPSTVRVVELYYFAGLTLEETAQHLAIGRATAVRRWRFARAWLRGELASAAAGA